MVSVARMLHPPRPGMLQEGGRNAHGSMCEVAAGGNRQALGAKGAHRPNERRSPATTRQATHCSRCGSGS